jgi:hypothetical protein
MLTHWALHMEWASELRDGREELGTHAARDDQPPVETVAMERMTAWQETQQFWLVAVCTLTPDRRQLRVIYLASSVVVVRDRNEGPTREADCARRHVLRQRKHLYARGNDEPRRRVLAGRLPRSQ